MEGNGALGAPAQNRRHHWNYHQILCEKIVSHFVLTVSKLKNGPPYGGHEALGAPLEDLSVQIEVTIGFDIKLCVKKWCHTLF